MTEDDAVNKIAEGAAELTLHRTLPFLLAIPICEAVDKLQDAGYFAPLVQFP